MRKISARNISKQFLPNSHYVLENISYGNPNATLDQIHQAAKDAYCWDFIQDFPEGFNTEVGDRGLKLSGGQKQRIAIARAILRNPQFLILDEATSALDPENEASISRVLAALHGQMTIILVGHRDSIRASADSIIELAGGRVVSQESRQETGCV